MLELFREAPKIEVCVLGVFFEHLHRLIAFGLNPPSFEIIIKPSFISRLFCKITGSITSPQIIHFNPVNCS